EHPGKLAPNAVYLELLGNGIFDSINYDRRLNDRFDLRAGFGYITLGASAGALSSSVTVVSVPLMANVLLGPTSSSSHFELGAGATVLGAWGSSGSSAIGVGFSGVTAMPTTTIGYRYQPRSGGFVFRVGVTPSLIFADRAYAFVSGGLSFGY